MALIHNMKKQERNSRIHSEVKTTYNIVSQKGMKVLQINTYGSDQREAKDVVSQTIQFDRSSLKQLLEIAKQEFDL